MNTEHLLPARDYVATQTGSRLFPSVDALHHFARLHASELGNSICTHRGRRYVNVPVFERAVADIITTKSGA